MTLVLEELGIRVVLISCTWLLSIQTTQLFPSYTTKGKLCEHVVIENFKFPLRDLNSNSHHRNSMCYYWATTPLFSMHWMSDPPLKQSWLTGQDILTNSININIPVLQCDCVTCNGMVSILLVLWWCCVAARGITDPQDCLPIHHTPRCMPRKVILKI